MSADRPLVLIADDEKDIRFILADTLTSAGFPVIEAADGDQARLSAEAEHPAVILLDVRLPKVDGMTLLSELRAKGTDVGIVIMTAHGNERLAVRAMKEGADDYLPKPFDPDDVILVVDRVLHHRETERTSAALARAVERERGRLEAIFRQMNQGLLTTARDLIVDSCNPMAETILGVPRQEIVGSPLATVFPALFAGAPEGVVPEAAVSGPGIEVEVACPGGQSKPLLVSVGGIGDAGADRSGWIVVFQDLSNIKALEREKTEFVGMMAHDLKGPLTSVYATIELLLDRTLGEVSEKQEEFLNIAHANTIRIRKMIDAFLETYRMEAGKIAFSMGPVKPSTFIELVHKRYLPVASEHSLQFTVSVAPDLPTVAGDLDHLVRILDNLLSNAFKFTADGGAVTVTAQRDPSAPDTRLMVTVADTGQGIPAEYLPRVFDKFSQGRRRSGAGGIGLGLAYCRMAVDRHGGRIGAESTEGKGSTFWFTLPFSQESGPSAGAAAGRD